MRRFVSSCFLHFVIGETASLVDSSACRTVAGGQAPAGIAIDGTGAIFTAQIYAHNVLKWTTPQNSVVVGSGGHQWPTGMALDSDGQIILGSWADGLVTTGLPGQSWSKLGEGELTHVTDVALDPAENVLVIDVDGSGNGRIMRYEKLGPGNWSASGTPVTTGPLLHPTGFCVRGDILYVSSCSEYANVANFVARWEPPYSSGTVVAGQASMGSSLEHFNCPVGVFVDDSDVIYVADRHNKRVVAWPPDGAEGVSVIESAEGQALGTPEHFASRDNFLYISERGPGTFGTATNGRVLECPLPTTTITATTTTPTTTTVTFSTVTGTVTTSATSVTSSSSSSSSTSSSSSSTSGATSTSSSSLTSSSTTSLTTATSSLSTSTRTNSGSTSSTTTGATSSGTITSLSGTSSSSLRSSATSMSMTTMSSSSTSATTTSSSRTSTSSETASLTSTSTTLSSTSSRSTSISSSSSSSSSVARSSTSTRTTTLSTSSTTITTTTVTTSRTTTTSRASTVSTTSSRSTSTMMTTSTSTVSSISSSTSSITSSSTTTAEPALMPVVVGGIDLGELEADAVMRGKFIDAVEESCLEMMVRKKANAPHTREFWATRLRANSIGAVAETAVAGLDAEAASAMASTEEFLDIVLEKVTGVANINNFLLPGATLYVLKETTTATTTTTSKTVTTSTSTTTSTTTLPSPEEAAKAVFAAVEEASANLLGALGDSNETTAVAELPGGGKMAVSKLEVDEEALAEAVAALLAAPGGGTSGGTGDDRGSSGGDGGSGDGDAYSEGGKYVEPDIPSVNIEVALPVTMFADFQVNAGVAPADIALVVTEFDPNSANMKALGKRPDPEKGGVKIEVAGAATIDLKNLASGGSLTVNGLRDPIKFSLPANYTPGMKCAYWAEEEQAWSTNGVWVSKSSVPGQNIICWTRHLSLFGALIESIIKSLVCAHVLHLMNKEAVEEVLEGSWLSSMSAAVFGFFLGMLAVNFLAAAVIDHRRGLLYHFKDEFLLVHNKPAPTDPPQDAPTDPPQGGALRKWTCQALCACCLWLQESDVIRQALDDICSSWFEYFGEVRTGVETCLECVVTDTAAIGSGVLGAKLKAMSHNITSKLMLMVSRRTAAANLCMTEDVVAFALDDEDLVDYLLLERSQGTGDWRRTQDQRSAIAGLREEVSHHTLRMTVHQGDARPHHLKFLRTVMMLLLTQNPVGALFVMDIFTSCKQRVLVFSAEIMGALVVSCVFFEGTGMAKGKRKGAGCASEDDSDDVMQQMASNMGRFMVIALTCLIVAGLPVHLLTSLQTKKFKMMTSPPSSQAWRRQLRAWKFQESLVVVTSLLYITACIAYITMFVANIGEADHQDWSLMGMLALFQDVLLIPFLTALIVPLSAQVLISMHLCISGTTREQFVRSVCERLHNSSNAMLPIEPL